MGRLPAIALFAADDEAAAAEDDVPMFKREDAAADAAATDPPPVLRPATCAASDRRVTAAAADMVEQVAMPCSSKFGRNQCRNGKIWMADGKRAKKTNKNGSGDRD